MTLVKLSFNMQNYIFLQNIECSNNQCSILLLEFSDTGSTEGHFYASDLIQVLFLHIHNFHLKCNDWKYFRYIKKLFFRTTLNIPSWLVLWFVPSTSALTWQGCI